LDIFYLSYWQLLEVCLSIIGEHDSPQDPQAVFTAFHSDLDRLIANHTTAKPISPLPLPVPVDTYSPNWRETMKGNVFEHKALRAMFHHFTRPDYFKKHQAVGGGDDESQEGSNSDLSREYSPLFAQLYHSPLNFLTLCNSVTQSLTY
jgi:hypothetical protein